jgi:GcrA cell cycle regulator
MKRYSRFVKLCYNNQVRWFSTRRFCGTILQSTQYLAHDNYLPLSGRETTRIGLTMSWTEERVTLLRELWGNGKSASEIAEILGGVTRNAVIGKAHRLQLSGRPSPIKAKGDGEGEGEVEMEAKPPRKKAKEEPQGATILSLTDLMCRWPIGDPKLPGFSFCGKPTNGTLPYCKEHAQAAYQQPHRQRESNSSNNSSRQSPQGQKITA